MLELLKQLILNKWKVKATNVRFGLFSRVGGGSVFEGNNRMGKFSFFSGKIGKFSYIGDNVILMGGGVGRFTSISSNVHVINGRHPIKTPYVSTSPVFYARYTQVNYSLVKEQMFEEYSFVDKKEALQVLIGNDCWIGDGVSIVGGVKVEDGAVLLANATVTKDVPPYAIVAGVPAKIIGYRYNQSTIEKLLNVKWWNKDESWLKENSTLFSDIESFLTRYCEDGI